MNDDLRGVERGLEKIAEKLNHPFQRADEDHRNKKLVNAQEKTAEVLNKTVQVQEQLVHEIRDASKEQSRMALWNKSLIIATVFLGIVSLLIAGWTAHLNQETASLSRENLLLQKDLYSEKLAVEIHSNTEIIGNPIYPNSLVIPKDRVSQPPENNLQIPITITINNYGLTPVQIEESVYELSCSREAEQTFREKNFVIKPGDSYTFTDTTFNLLSNINWKSKSCILTIRVATAENSYTKQFPIMLIADMWNTSYDPELDTLNAGIYKEEN